MYLLDKRFLLHYTSPCCTSKLIPRMTGLESDLRPYSPNPQILRYHLPFTFPRNGSERLRSSLHSRPKRGPCGTPIVENGSRSGSIYLMLT